MKTTLLFASLLLALDSFEQCPYPVTLRTSGTSCVGATLSVNTFRALSGIVWYQDNIPVKTVTGTVQTGSLSVAAGGSATPFNLPSQVSYYNTGLFVDDKGDIWLADNTGNRVVKWSASGGWTTVAGTGVAGSGAAQLNSPQGVFVDQAGDLYIADRGNWRIQKWAPGATSGVTVAGGNGSGPNANQVEQPYGIYVDCASNIYVADQENNRVQKWAPDAGSGITVAGGNGPGSAANQLNQPYGVWLDGAGNVYVADAGNGRVQKWAPGASSGVTVAGGNGQLNTPNSLFVDNSGNVYVSEFAGDRIIKWAPGATAGTIVVSGPVASYFDVFVDNKGNIYGMGTRDNHLQVLPQSDHIDLTYQPAAPGKYYAVVTDVNGYTSSSDTISIFSPAAAPPSIHISASAVDVDLCQPVNFQATVTNGGTNPSYQWQVSSVNTGGDSSSYSNDLFANGDKVYCLLTTVGMNCALETDTSNIITLSVDPESYATVKITASDTAVCAGTPVDFTATVANASFPPLFRWFVNGVATGDTTALFADTSHVSGVVYCQISSNAPCGLAKSNSIGVMVYPVPVIASGQVFNIPHGESSQLEPVISGEVADYLWTPGTGLSDSTIRDPVADPSFTTDYTLKVTAPGGCTTKGVITVYVYTPLRIPNAFTPDGDGRNDRLYVLGGPEGSSIREMAVYDRWGARVFGVKDVMPGDRRYGWDGTIGGRPAPAGTYVYLVRMQFPGGSQQVYKGTVILLR
ncbi:MAG TPA: gliding motility-associated C-terminal domain-containing protein [Puia sp.]|nr:gliding motility-associated C-terminal domain-containing protein [Puia sp.]